MARGGAAVSMLDDLTRIVTTGSRGNSLSKVSQSDYRALAAFRYELRRFLAFSERAARSAGIEPQQHQLLLAIHGLPAGTRATIRTIAERLCVQHHTAVALVDRLEERKFVLRERSSEDRREVLLRLTNEGVAQLRILSALHRDHLRTVGPNMLTSLGVILGRLQAPRAEGEAEFEDPDAGAETERASSVGAKKRARRRSQ